MIITLQSGFRGLLLIGEVLKTVFPNEYEFLLPANIKLKLVTDTQEDFIYEYEYAPGQKDEKPFGAGPIMYTTWIAYKQN
jgi:hypothetical protein